MSGIITTAGRSITAVTAEINMLTQQLQVSAIQTACQIGKRLMEAKELVPHGEWGDYLANEIGYKSSTASNYMRLFKEYGEGGPNCQAIGSLPPTHALRLLALPEGEREEFAESNDVGKMSVRQLEQEIKQLRNRAEAAEASDKAGRTLLANAVAENGDLQQQLSTIHADYKAQLDVVDAENDKLRKDLQEAQYAPAEISPEEAEKLRQEGAAAADAAAQERITAAQAMQKAAEDRSTQLQSRIDDLKAELRKKDEAKSGEKPTALADPDAALFEVTLQQIGELANRLVGLRMKAQGRNPRVAAAMTSAMKKFVDALSAQIGG